MLPSTAYPEALPSISVLRGLTQSLAMLDALLCPEFQYRYYSFDFHWDGKTQAAFMRNGSGDEWRVIFDPDDGALLVGSAHELPAGEEGEFAEQIRATVPASFRSLMEEPNSTAFVDFATFCLWRQKADPVWQVVIPSSFGSRRPNDGSMELLAILDGDPLTYQQWAEDYYERTVLLCDVQAIYGQQPLDPGLSSSLNPTMVWAEVVAEAQAIGYSLADDVRR